MSNPESKQKPNAISVKFDRRRLDELCEQARLLRASGNVSFLREMLARLSEEELRLYRQPLTDWLHELAQPSDVTVLKPIGKENGDHEDRAERPDASDDAPPPSMIGRFRIERELGRGAFGTVYHGYDPELQRQVAIKVSHLPKPVLQQSLRVEATKLAQIESPGIIPVYEVGKTDEGLVYLVEKYIEGRSLKELLTEKGTISPALAVWLTREIALALEQAHLRDILHRDLKPENILIDKQGHPWIVDFGLAISEYEQQGSNRSLVGTLPYMSPEQTRGRVDFMDPRSDIWSLGVVYYGMLCGRLPFHGKNRKTLFAQICQRDARPLHQRFPNHLTASINDVFQRCCEKQPAHRYATVRELVNDLDQLIAAGLSNLNAASEPTDFPLVSRAAEPDAPTIKRSRDSTLGSRGANGTESNEHTGMIPKRVLPPSSYFALGALAIAASVFALLAWNSLIAPAMQTNSGQLNPDRTERSGIVDAVAQSTDASTIGQPDPPFGTSDNPWRVAKRKAGGGTFESIAEAIRIAGAGDFIRVAPGTYTERITVSKPVSIEGERETIDGKELTPVIENSHRTPVTIDCDGEVLMTNIFIAGFGHSLTEEFNAVDLRRGRLAVRGCNFSTESYNCIKVASGAALVAVGCEFLESNRFAISTRPQHSRVDIDRCVFHSDGVQIVGGTDVNVKGDSISNSMFHGERGVSVQSSLSPVNVVDCEFGSNDSNRFGPGFPFDTGVEKTFGLKCSNGGKIDVSGTSVFNRKHGVWIESPKVSKTDSIEPGLIRLQNSRIERCQFAVTVQDGELEALSTEQGDELVVQSCNYGIDVDGGTARLQGTLFANISDNCLRIDHSGSVELKDGRMERCSGRAIDVISGALSFTGGTIQECGSAAIYFGDQSKWPDLTASGKVTGVSLIEVAEGIRAVAGPVSVTDVTVSTAEFGVRATGPADRDEPTVEITLTRTTFESQVKCQLAAEGNVRITLDSDTNKSVKQRTGERRHFVFADSK